MHHQELNDDAAIDDRLVELLAIDPSPEFRARVRQQVAVEVPRRGFRSWALGVVAAGAVAGVALMFGGLKRPATRSNVAQPLTSRALRVDTGVLIGRTGMAPAVRVPATAAGATSQREIDTATWAAEVLVDPGEARAIRTFIDEAVNGRLDQTAVSGTPTSLQVDPPQDISIAPIQLSPLAGDEKEGRP